VRLAGFDPVVWNVDVTPGLVSLDRRRLALRLGERATLTARVTDDSGKQTGPADGIQWSSNHPEAVRASGPGIMDGMGLGHAVVTASAPWGQRDSADVFVVSDAVVASNRSGTYGIYQFRAAAGDTLVPLLVDGAANVQAVYSPDRTRVVFSSSRSGSYDLFVMDADGRNLSRITRDPGNESEPRWTPDGSRIVYTLTPAGGLPQIHSVGIAGQDDRLVTGPPHGNQSPALSHDGKHLAFVSNRDGDQEIYLMDLPSGAPRRLTRTKERESSPHFLPDGALVYVTEAGGRHKGSRIMRIAPAAAEPTPLLVTEYPIHSLDISADGSRAIYVVGQPGSSKGRTEFRMFIQPLAGGAASEITLRAAEQVVGPAF
jgi:Tol biopolymer transport system component